MASISAPFFDGALSSARPAMTVTTNPMTQTNKAPRHRSANGDRCGTAGIVLPLVLDLFLVDGEACFQVVRQGGRVVLGAGVQPVAPGAIAPRLVDGPLEKVPPHALADEFGHQAELNQFDLALGAPVQLGKASRYAIGHQDVDFEPGVVQQGGEFGVGELLAARPVVV